MLQATERCASDKSLVCPGSSFPSLKAEHAIQSNSAIQIIFILNIWKDHICGLEVKESVRKQISIKETTRY